MRIDFDRSDSVERRESERRPALLQRVMRRVMPCCLTTLSVPGESQHLRNIRPTDNAINRTRLSPQSVVQIRPSVPNPNTTHQLADGPRAQALNPLPMPRLNAAPIEFSLWQMSQGQQPRPLDLGIRVGRTYQQDQLRLLVWTKRRIESNLAAQRQIFIIQNQHQLDRALRVPILDTNGNLSHKPGLLLENLRLGCVLIIDETGFDVAQLEAFNELKQDNRLNGEQFSATNFIVSAVDQIAANKGKRSAALVSRSAYMQLANEHLPAAPLLSPNAAITSQFDEHGRKRDDLKVIDLADNQRDWHSLVYGQPNLHTNGWHMQPAKLPEPGSKSALANKATILIRNPPTMDLELQAAIECARNDGNNVLVENGVPEQERALHRHNKRPLSELELQALLAAQADCIFLTNSEFDRLSSAHLLLQSDGAVETVTGPLAPNDQSARKVVIAQNLEPRQWQRLMEREQPLFLAALPEVQIPVEYRQQVHSLSRDCAINLFPPINSIVDAKPGIYQLFGSSDRATYQPSNLLKTNGQLVHHHVLPGEPIEAVFGKWQVQSEGQFDLQACQFIPSLLLKDLYAGESVVLHGVQAKHLPYLESLSGLLGQVIQNGKRVGWREVAESSHSISELSEPINGKLLLASQKKLARSLIPTIEQSLEPTQNIDSSVFSGAANDLNSAYEYGTRVLSQSKALLIKASSGLDNAGLATNLATTMQRQCLYLNGSSPANRWQQQLRAFSEAPESGAALIITELNQAPVQQLAVLLDYLYTDKVVIGNQRVDVPKNNRLIATSSQNLSANQEEVFSGIDQLVIEAPKTKTEVLDYLRIQLVSLETDGLIPPEVSETLNLDDLLDSHQCLQPLLAERFTLQSLIRATTTLAIKSKGPLNSQEALSQTLQAVYINALPVAEQTLAQHWLLQNVHPSASESALEISTATMVATRASGEFAWQVNDWLQMHNTLSLGNETQAKLAQHQLSSQILLIEGPAGRGKDEIVRYCLTRARAPKSWKTLNANYDVTKLEPELELAMRNGHMLVVSEINLVPAPQLEQLFKNLISEQASATPGFGLIGTINPAAGYTGRSQLPSSILNQLAHIQIPDYDRADQLRIAASLLGGQPSDQLVQQVAAKIVDHHRQVQLIADQYYGAIKPTTRELTQVCMQLARHLQQDSNETLAVLDQHLTHQYRYYTSQEALLPRSPATQFDRLAKLGLGLLIPESTLSIQAHIDTTQPSGVVSLQHNQLRYTGPASVEALATSLSRYKQIESMPKEKHKPPVVDPTQQMAAITELRDQYAASPLGHYSNNTEFADQIFYFPDLEPVDALGPVLPWREKNAQIPMHSLSIHHEPIEHNLQTAQSLRLLVPKGQEPVAVSINNSPDPVDIQTNGTSGWWIDNDQAVSSIQIQTRPLVQQMVEIPTSSTQPKKVQFAFDRYPALKQLLDTMRTKSTSMQLSSAQPELSVQQKIDALQHWLQYKSQFRYSLAGQRQASHSQSLQENLDQLLTSKIGACVDFSKLMSTLLYELNIPNKIVSGFTAQDGKVNRTRHAWVEYLDINEQRAGYIDLVIPISDADQAMMDNAKSDSTVLGAGIMGADGVRVDIDRVVPLSRGVTSDQLPRPLASPTEVVKLYETLSFENYLLDSRVHEAINQQLQQCGLLPEPATIDERFNAEGVGQLDLDRAAMGRPDFWRSSEIERGGSAQYFLQIPASVELDGPTVFLMARQGISTSKHLTLPNSTMQVLSDPEQVLAVCKLVKNTFQNVLALIFSEEMTQVAQMLYVSQQHEELQHDPEIFSFTSGLNFSALTTHLAMILNAKNFSNISMPLKIPYAGPHIITPADITDALNKRSKFSQQFKVFLSKYKHSTDCIEALLTSLQKSQFLNRTVLSTASEIVRDTTIDSNARTYLIDQLHKPQNANPISRVYAELLSGFHEQIQCDGMLVGDVVHTTMLQVLFEYAMLVTPDSLSSVYKDQIDAEVRGIVDTATTNPRLDLLDYAIDRDKSISIKLLNPTVTQQIGRQSLARQLEPCLHPIN